MTVNLKVVQTPAIALYSGLAAAGTSMVVTPNPVDLDGVKLTMSDFGTLGYCTVDPKISGYEEIISFTGITDNGDGTSTLTGLSRDLTSKYPYTTSGTGKLHGSSAIVVFSNNPQIYGRFAGKDNDETITGKWVFPDDPSRPGIASDTDTSVATAFVTLGQLSRTASSGASNASTTVKGIIQLATQAQADAKTTTGATGAKLVLTPDVQRSTLTSDYVVDTGAANAYVITPSPAITAYAAGQTFTFKAANSNTGASTINVSGVGTKNIFKNGVGLGGAVIVAGQTYVVVYDAIQFQLFSQDTTPSGTISMFATAVAPGGWLNCDGSAVSRTTYAPLFAVISTAFGTGDGSTTFNVPDLRSRSPMGTGTGTKVFTFSSRSSNLITVTGVANSVNNELQTGAPLLYTAASPMTGLTTATTYYVIRNAYNQFSLATTLANAQAGTPISLSSDGSGSQTFAITYSVRTLADTGGEELHSLVSNENGTHTHAENFYTTGSATAPAQQAGTANATPVNNKLPPTDPSGLGSGHNIVSPFLAVNFIIKT